MNYNKALQLANGVKGTLVELGFGKGNSLREFISYMNNGNIDKRNIWIYESFTGYNTPRPEDKGAFVKGGHKRPPQPAYDIKHTITKDVHLVKGYIEDTLPEQYGDEKVAIIHSHLISYSSTKHGLEVFHKGLQTNGIIVVTDYEIFPGTKQAVDEFILSKKGEYKLIEQNTNFACIKKVNFKDLLKNPPKRTRSILI